MTYLTQNAEPYEYELLFWNRHGVCKLIMLKTNKELGQEFYMEGCRPIS